MINNNITSPSFKNMLKTEAKGASIYTLSTFLLRFGSFLIVPLFWKKLSVSDYGIIAIVEIIGAFLGMFVGLQLELSITRFYYEWAEKSRKQQVGTIWLAGWISVGVFGVLSIYIVSLISNVLFKDVAFYPYIYLGLIYIIIGKFSTIPFATIRIINKPILYAIYSVVDFAIKISLNIYFVLILDKQLHGLFISNIIGYSISAFFGFLVMLRFATPCIKVGTLIEALNFSLPLIPGAILSGITKFLDQFLLQTFASIEVLGIYNISLKFTNLVMQLHSALKTSYVPYMVKIVSKDKNWGIKMLSKMRLFYLLPLFLIAMAIGLYIKDFVYWINRTEYFPVVKWVPVLIVPALFSTFTIYLAPGLFLSKRSDLTWIPSAVQLLVVLLSGLLLIPTFKIAGVVISRYLSVLSLFLVTFILSEKHYPIPVKWMTISLMLGFLVLFIFISSFIVFNNLITSLLFHTILLILFCIILIATSIGFSQIRTVIVSKHKNNI